MDSSSLWITTTIATQELSSLPLLLCFSFQMTGDLLAGLFHKYYPNNCGLIDSMCLLERLYSKYAGAHSCPSFPCLQHLQRPPAIMLTRTSAVIKKQTCPRQNAKLSRWEACPSQEDEGLMFTKYTSIARMKHLYKPRKGDLGLVRIKLQGKKSQKDTIK